MNGLHFSCGCEIFQGSSGRTSFDGGDQLWNITSILLLKYDQHLQQPIENRGNSSKLPLYCEDRHIFQIQHTGQSSVDNCFAEKRIELLFNFTIISKSKYDNNVLELFILLGLRSVLLLLTFILFSALIWFLEVRPSTELLSSTAMYVSWKSDLPPQALSMEASLST